MNKLVNITDSIDFGSQKGEPFYLVYRLHISYLEWIINETDYCFLDLSDFYKFGKIKRLNESISTEKKKLIINEVRNNPTCANAENTRLITIRNFNNLIQQGHLTTKDFIDVHYKFSENLIKKNADKLKFSHQYKSLKFMAKSDYKHNFFYED